MIIESDGQVVFYNHVKKDISDAEYTYHGVCSIDENIVYIHLKNDFSNERATMFYIRSVGNANRFIGLFTALSSNIIPICIKIACFKENLYNSGINKELLKKILTSNNANWENNMLIIEEHEKHLFFLMTW